MWRGRYSLQLGVEPTRAVVLELPDPAAARVLDLLDGSRSERGVIAAASRSGINPADVRSLLDTLRCAGLVVGAQSLLPHSLPEPMRRRLTSEVAALALRGIGVPAAPTPAQIMRRRSAARVVVTGHGRLAAPVAIILAQAGVGHVAPDVDGPRGAGASAAVIESIHRVAPGTRTGPVRRRDTTFVVQVGATGPAVLAAAGYAQRRLAHLAVSVRDGTIVIGPLVPPGGAPCLHCVDLHRRDRDPIWPELAAQLAAAGRDRSDDQPCAAATALAGASFAAGEVLHWVDGTRPTTLGASVEISAPGDARRRTWPPHPACHCVRRSGWL